MGFQFFGQADIAFGIGRMFQQLTELVAIAFQKAVEFGLVFVRKDGQFGGESMFEGIVAGGGLARFGSRPGSVSTSSVTRGTRLSKARPSCHGYRPSA